MSEDIESPVGPMTGDMVRVKWVDILSVSSWEKSLAIQGSDPLTRWTAHPWAS